MYFLTMLEESEGKEKPKNFTYNSSLEEGRRTTRSVRQDNCSLT